MKLVAAAVCLLALGFTTPGSRPRTRAATPIQHLVVIFGENISFDHYFGTYPVAANPPGETPFRAMPGTPTVDGLTSALLTHNPNLNPENGVVAGNPFRIDRTQAATASQWHDYTLEQLAYHGGAADLFPKYTGRGAPGGAGAFATSALVMGYFDGNTVTALWHYAQHFAMNDNAYGDQYGPSTPGALNLIAGQTNGMTIVASTDSEYYVHDGQGGLTMIGDVDPAGDVCSDSLNRVWMTGPNIGDLLNTAGVRWGWFEGGFDLTATNRNGSTGCRRATLSTVTGLVMWDYLPHHQPFQYYRSTANPTHARPSALAGIGGASDGANHQYDVRDFFAAVGAGNFPAVAFLKASGYQDGHAGYSNPLDEQTFVTEVVNFLERSPEWAHTAVLILYDDSDGWYDHRFGAITNASFDARRDRVSGSGACGVRGETPQLGGVADKGPVNGRCGPGARQPFLVISPWARVNFVDHTPVTQASVLRFIEDNWLGGRRLGGGSFDATAGSILGMFDFSGTGDAPRLMLDTLGVPSDTAPPLLPQ